MAESRNWIKKVTWADVREKVMEVNPDFAQAVDSVDPGNLPLYHASYSYGQPIVKDGILHVADEKGKIVPISDNNLDSDMRTAFDDPPGMPIGIMLKNSIEVYFDGVDGIVPWGHMKSGKIFALWALLQPKNTSSQRNIKTWQIRAGARSLIMQPKIGYERFFKRLKKTFRLDSTAPEKLADQWPVFAELANSPGFKQSWSTEMIFLTSEWYQKLEDLAWHRLWHFLLKTAWTSTAFVRDQPIFDFAFSQAMKECNLRPNPYLSDAVKHLYVISNGIFPGYKVAVDDTAGPVTHLQEIFSELYGLKSAPIMMHLEHRSPLSENTPLYYSLELPLIMSFSPKSHKEFNKLDDLREIKHIHKVIRNYILEDKHGLEGSPVYDLLTQTHFEYFHSDNDKYEQTKNSRLLPEYDSDLKCELSRYPKKNFNATSPFLRGCVLISGAK